MARKAGALILCWVVGLIGAIVLAPFSTIALGIAVGSVLTAIVMGLTVKWSVRAMVDETVGDIEAMNEQLDTERKL